MVHHWIRLCEQGAQFCGKTNLQIEFLQIGPQSGFSRYLDTHFSNIHISDIFNVENFRYLFQGCIFFDLLVYSYLLKMPFLADFIKKWVHFIKNSDVTSLVIYQSQPKLH